MSHSSEWDFPNTATEPGSAAYYVVRFSPKGQQNTLARWFAWFEHIDSLAAKANDPGVARLKLDWWREETRNLLLDQGRHPLAEALSAQVTSQQQVQQMHRALDAIEQRILRHTPRTLEEYHQQCGDQFASRLHLLCGNKAGDQDERIEALGRQVATASRLAALGADLRDDYLSLPQTMLAKHGLKAEQLLEAEKRQVLNELGAQLLDTEGQPNTADLRQIANHESLQPAIRYAAQSFRLARLLKKRRFDPDQHHQLTPIGLLWSAWRMR